MCRHVCMHVHRHVCRHGCRHVYRHGCGQLEMCIDTCMDKCVDMCIGMCTDMCMDMCKDMCIDMSLVGRCHFGFLRKLSPLSHLSSTVGFDGRSSAARHTMPTVQTPARPFLFSSRLVPLVSPCPPPLTSVSDPLRRALSSLYFFLPSALSALRCTRAHSCVLSAHL